MNAINEIRKMLSEVENKKPRKVECYNILVKQGETKEAAIKRTWIKNNIVEQPDTDFVYFIDYEKPNE
jgi:hypothetical protein